MSKPRLALATVGLILSAPLAKSAPVSFGGQIRARAEATNIESYATALKRHGLDQSLLRVRLNAEAVTDKKINAFLQIQDSRVFGSEASVTANTANIDLHQGYVDVLELFDLPLDLRAGRMELSYGDQRLVSPLDWSNVGRAWDGARLKLKLAAFTLDSFVTNVKQTADTRRNQHFWGFYASAKPHDAWETDAFILGRDFGDGTQTAELGNKGNLSDRTLGGRVKGALGGFDHTSEIAWQFGRKAGQSVRAWAAAATAGYSFDHTIKPRVGVEYDYASGDANPSDNRARTFDPLFPLGHAYQGYQDIFSWKNGHDIVGNVSAFPTPGWKLQCDFHHFLMDHSFDSWYDASGAAIARDTSGVSGRHVGDELDLHLRGKFRDTIGVWLGYSYFFAGRFARYTSVARNRQWTFLQATFSF